MMLLEICEICHVAQYKSIQNCNNLYSETVKNQGAAISNDKTFTYTDRRSEIGRCRQRCRTAGVDGNRRGAEGCRGKQSNTHPQEMGIWVYNVQDEYQFIQ